MWKLSVATLVLAISSLFVGVGDMISDWEAAGDLLFTSRIPRTIAVLLTGSSLALAGLIMQAIACNRFVDPMIAGSGQSAALGVLAISMLAPQASIAIKMVSSSVAACVGTGLFIALTSRLPRNEPYLLPLVGLVYGGILSAIAVGVAWYADVLQFLEVWTNGEFSGVLQGRYELLWIAAALCVFAWWIADRLTIFSLGKETSIGLGLNYNTTQRAGLVIVALIAASTVVTVGMLPFVGLVVPAFVSRYWGDNIRETLHVVIVSGALLVLASDLAGRIVRFPYEIPAGTVLGVIGAIAFIVMLFNRSYRHV